MTITKQVIFVAKEENIGELKALLTDMVKPSQKSEGCLLYHIYQMDDKPNTFVVIESWVYHRNFHCTFICFAH